MEGSTIRPSIRQPGGFCETTIHKSFISISHGLAPLPSSILTRARLEGKVNPQQTTGDCTLSDHLELVALSRVKVRQWDVLPKQSTKMPTNRPFLANFFAAFRAHSAIQKASSASSSGVNSSSVSVTQTSHVTASSTSNSTSLSAVGPPNSRSMATKTPTMPIGATTAAVQAASHLQTTRRARQASTSPLSASPGNPNYLGNAMGSASSPRRRSSSSSGDGGFRDVLGAEKWYIGGIGPGGEERFYRLGMVRRHRSIDRLSLDRLSM